MKDFSKSIARILLKTAKKKDIKAVSEWERKTPGNASFTEGLKDYWNQPVTKHADHHLDLAKERLLVRINDRNAERKQHSLSYKLMRIAAIFIFAISISGLSIFIGSKTNLFSHHQGWVEVATEAGQQSKVTLPDGSLVWLNAKTVLKYQPNKKNRLVNLIGEAYFEVSHNKNYPFVVEAGDTRVKVLGTKFDVSNYPDSKLTSTSLLSGKIELSLNKEHQSVILKPGEKAIYNQDKRTITKTKTEVENDVLWKQGILFFENEQFNDLILKLERYYGVTFVYDEKPFENIHYTGTINNQTINNVLEFINLTIPINYEIDNKTIQLSLKK